MLEKMIIETVEKLGRASQNMPKVWDGRESILEMKNAGFKYWKEVEWMDLYFKFLCQKHFRSIIDIPGKKYGNTDFDAFHKIPWDFKAHAANTTSYNIVANDVETITDTMHSYSYYGIILAIGNVVYDKDNVFKKWHDELRKEICEYERNKINGGVMSRTRKITFFLEEIHFICFNSGSLHKCCSMLQNPLRDTGSSKFKPKEIIIDIQQIPNASLVATEIFYGEINPDAAFQGKRTVDY